MEAPSRWGEGVFHFYAGYRSGEILNKSAPRFSIENKSILASAWSLAGTVRRHRAIVYDAPGLGEPRWPAQLTYWSTNE